MRRSPTSSERKAALEGQIEVDEEIETLARGLVGHNETRRAGAPCAANDGRAVRRVGRLQAARRGRIAAGKWSSGRFRSTSTRRCRRRLSADRKPRRSWKAPPRRREAPPRSSRRTHGRAFCRSSIERLTVADLLAQGQTTSNLDSLRGRDRRRRFGRGDGRRGGRKAGGRAGTRPHRRAGDERSPLSSRSQTRPRGRGADSLLPRRAARLVRAASRRRISS